MALFLVLLLLLRHNGDGCGAVAHAGDGFSFGGFVVWNRVLFFFFAGWSGEISRLKGSFRTSLVFDPGDSVVFARSDKRSQTSFASFSV